MNEHVTIVQCLRNKGEFLGRLHGDEPIYDEGKLTKALLDRAAATIEALEARVAELEGKLGDALLDAAYAEGRLDVAKQQIDELEAIPPSSPDTDGARAMAAHWEPATPRMLVEGMCDALAASRAECERLRGLLREAEWSGYIEGGPISDGGEWYPDCCPWCGGHRVDIGHAAGCPCAAALGDGQ